MFDRIVLVTLIVTALIAAAPPAAWATCGTAPTSTAADAQVRMKGSASFGNVAGVGTPAEGDIVYDATNHTVAVCNGSAWSDLAGTASASQWLNGSSGAIYYNSGYVGIGTPAPAVNLDVVGQGRISSSSQDAILALDDTGSGGRNYNIGSGGSGSGGGNGFYIYDVSGGAARLTINSSGNVGIGITNPTANLQVASGSKQISLNLSTNSTDSVLQLVSAATGNWTRITSNGSPIAFLTQGSDFSSNAPAMYIGSSGYVGVQTNTPPSYTLQVNGSVAGTSAYNNTSDARLKKNVEPIAYGLDTVLRLRPISFDWIDQSQAWKKKHQLGLIAQDVEPVVPEIVTIADDKMRTRSLAYGELVPVLIKAIQDLKAINDSEAAEIDTLKIRVDALEAAAR